MKGPTNKQSFTQPLSAMWALISIALLLLLRSPPAEGASNFHLRNHTGLLFLYDFTEGQRSEDVPTHARDITGRYLMGNLTTSPTAVSWSASRQGMRIPSPSGGVRAESQLSSAGMLSSLSSSFTLEFFFNSPNNLGSTFLLIAGLGKWPAGAPLAPCDANNVATEGGWRLYSGLLSSIVFDGVMSLDGVPTCFSLTVGISTNTLRHLIVRVENGFLSVVTHGAAQSAPIEDLQFSPALWARNPAPLTIANPHLMSGWTGTMYMMAMYDRLLDNDEIESNRGYGPPNSLPATLSSLSIPEDSTTTLYP